ncbi:sterol 3-beta-glucosyltransferase UGT80A2-like protein isoform X2 [Tanacetum coccineum]|uniref:Sterol 3-beta-glucosyltransferase UGT80A2-like protein isoform X2 n=1 Tax=Tanacetum coccineum TaxID=301880 RepID=A0ABQ5EHG5_9ASTR
MVLDLFQDPLPHVRLSAINATGRLSTNLDQDLQFQYHSRVPALATAISDFIHEFRLARAISAMVNISKNYVHEILTPYLHGKVSNLLQMLFGRIQVGNSCWELYCLEHGLKTIVAKSKDFVYLLDNCPHDWLFLQCVAVVHHGGAGTTAAGLKAAGVGPPPILVEEFSLKKLVSAIGFMLKPAVKVSAT